MSGLEFFQQVLEEAALLRLLLLTQQPLTMPAKRRLHDHVLLDLSRGCLLSIFRNLMQFSLDKFEQLRRYGCLFYFSLTYLRKVRLDLLDQLGLCRFVFAAVSRLVFLTARALALRRRHLERFCSFRSLRIMHEELLDLPVDDAVKVYIFNE